MLHVKSTASSAEDTRNTGQPLGGLGSGPLTGESRTVRTGNLTNALTPTVEAESEAPAS